MHRRGTCCQVDRFWAVGQLTARFGRNSSACGKGNFSHGTQHKRMELEISLEVNAVSVETARGKDATVKKYPADREIAMELLNSYWNENISYFYHK